MLHRLRQMQQAQKPLRGWQPAHACRRWKVRLTDACPYVYSSILVPHRTRRENMIPMQFCGFGKSKGSLPGMRCSAG